MFLYYFKKVGLSVLSAELEEIMPLFKDYFVGEITLSEKGIEYRLGNGQSFIISVQAGKT